MEQKKDSELISLTSWIEGMLCTAARRGEASVSFERDLKTRSIRSFSQNRTQLGAFLFRDWNVVISVLNDPRRELALHQFLREHAERLEKPQIPDADLPRISLCSNENLVWCSFTHFADPEAEPVEAADA